MVTYTPEQAIERFWDRIDARGDCWIWTGATIRGYGQLARDGKRIYAHNYAYTLLVGPIPPGHILDHLCRVHGCVNPDHLEPVTSRVNSLRGYSPYARKARQTHCIHGHEFTPDNTKIRNAPENKWRGCRICHTIQERKYRQARRQERKQVAS